MRKPNRRACFNCAAGQDLGTPLKIIGHDTHGGDVIRDPDLASSFEVGIRKSRIE